MDDEARVAAIRERAEAATEGPWFREYNSAVIPGPDEASTSAEWDAAQIAHCGKSRDQRDPQRIADANFIANAREDIPWLLDRLRAAEARAAEAEAIIAEARAEAWWEGVNDQWKHRPIGNRALETDNPHRKQVTE